MWKVTVKFYIFLMINKNQIGQVEIILNPLKQLIPLKEQNAIKET